MGSFTAPHARPQAGCRICRATTLRARAAEDSTGSRNLSAWLPGPLEAVAFLPRLTAGAVVTAADKLALVQPRLAALQELAQNSAMSTGDKQVRSPLLQLLLG